MIEFNVKFLGRIPHTYDRDGADIGPVLRWYVSGECPLSEPCSEIMPITGRAKMELYIEIPPNDSLALQRTRLVAGIDDFVKEMTRHNRANHRQLGSRRLA